jgi:hypothetical protein
MRRRDFVRGLVPIALAPQWLLSQQPAKPSLPPPAPVPWTLGLNPATPLPHTSAAETIAEPEPRFFSQMQMASLVRLCAVLVPAIGGKPGAVDAETPAFLDFLIGGSPAARQTVYTAGLDWLEAESGRKYKLPFAKLDDSQSDAVIKPWLRTWMSDHPPAELHASFINIAHDDIRSATINSKAWSDAPKSRTQGSTANELYWYPIEPDLHGLSAESARMQPHVLAAPKAAHTMPSYPR